MYHLLKEFLLLMVLPGRDPSAGVCRANREVRTLPLILDLQAHLP